MLDITVIIPAIPQRTGNLLREACASVAAQQLQPHEVIVEVDHGAQGPAHTRNAALGRVDSKWVAFLDDDDLMAPQHLQRLAEVQQETGADVLWPWFWVMGGTDPFPSHFGRQWDAEHPHIFPITTLVRTEVLRDVGGFRDMGEVADPNDASRTVAGEDWDLWLRISAAGARFHHVPERTWTWRHHANNTSGLPGRRR